MTAQYIFPMMKTIIGWPIITVATINLQIQNLFIGILQSKLLYSSVE